MQVEREIRYKVVAQARNQVKVEKFGHVPQVCAATFGHYSVTIDVLSLRLTNPSHTPDLPQLQVSWILWCNMSQNGPGFSKIHNFLKYVYHRYAPGFISHLRQVYHGFQHVKLIFGMIPTRGKSQFENVNIHSVPNWGRIREHLENWGSPGMIWVNRVVVVGIWLTFITRIKSIKYTVMISSASGARN